MSYERKEWETGDIITAEALNNLENGVADGGVLLFSSDGGAEIVTLDKTWHEIASAPFAVYVLEVEDEGVVVAKNFAYVTKIEPYTVSIYNFDMGQTIMFTANAPDDYPKFESR